MITENYYFVNDLQFSTEIKKSKLLNKKVVLIQIFASIKSKEAITASVKHIKSFFPQAIIIGATTDGEILESTVTTDSTVVSITAFEKSTLKINYIENCHIQDDSYDVGQSLASSLVQKDTKLMILFTDGLETNGEDFLKGVESSAPDVKIAGGMAGDSALFDKTYVIAGTEVLQHGAVAVAINSDNLHVETNYSFNWQGIGRKMRVDKATKNRVYQIDGKTAVEIYSHYLGEDVAKKLPSIGIEFPIIINRNGLPVARAVLDSHEDGSLVFAGNVEEGDEVQLGFGNIDMILEASDELVSSFQSYKLESIFVYSCMARRRFLNDDIKIELQGLQALAPLSGFFTYGEFYKDKSAQLLNETMTVLAMSESNEKVSKKKEIVKDKMKVDDFQLTLKALSHLVNQTSLELEDLNNTLADNIKQKTVALEDKVEELELATRVKSDFLANMSHEIRTPLNAILGFINILGRDETDSSRIKQFDIVKNSGDHLVDIINDILDFSKIESGKFEIENIRFNTRKPFADIYALFARKAQDKNIDLYFNFDSTLPVMSCGDELRIKQVLANLLSNAIKFTPDNGKITVDVFGQNDKKHISCSVNDSGTGISKEHQNHIFDAFSQADSSTTRKFGGTGLGLSISSKLVSLMNGEIFLESEIDEGSTFCFRLPIFCSECNTNEVSINEEDVLNIEDFHFNKKALVVEDNKSNQMLMKIFLTEMGFDIVMADDGELGYRAFLNETFDVVLMDENMPNMNGIDSTKLIREYEFKHQKAKTCIIAITANALKGDREKFIAAGMDDYVSKPVDVDELKRVLYKNLIEG